MRPPKSGRMEATTTQAALGRYVLGRRLGTGGFGTVHEAVDERLDRRVAVKVIPADGARTGERERREALAAARLDHPAIVAVLDAGEEDGVRYLVSELVEGASLAELLGEPDGISDRDALRVGIALCDALAHAHERGVVHRDVKPANLLVPDRGGVPVKLCDFGVAHLADEPLTRTGDVIGTLAYMAPEQAEGKRVDHRADLYSAALVLYEALARRNPVRGSSPADTARRVGRPVPPLRKARGDLPQELCAAIDRALKARPAERGSLDDLATALSTALPLVSDDGRALARLPQEGRPARVRLGPVARRLLAGAAAGGLAAVAAGATGHPEAAAWAALTAAVVAALPRAGWAAAALAAVAAVAIDRPGAALVLAAALAGPVLLLPRTGTAWSLPAAAPALGLAGLAAAYPALAGQARRLPDRLALGALGAAWLLLQRVPGGAWERDPAAAPAAVARAVGEDWTLVPAFALAAAALPFLVRGRSAGLDAAGAAAWAAALGAATQSAGPAVLAGVAAAAARWLAGPVAQGAPAILLTTRPATGGPGR